MCLRFFLPKEIPTGLYLLRMIPKTTFQKKFPDMKYEKFVLSSILRICLGYFFLVNVMIALIQADSVIEVSLSGFFAISRMPSIQLYTLTFVSLLSHVVDILRCFGFAVSNLGSYFTPLGS